MSEVTKVRKRSTSVDGEERKRRGEGEREIKRSQIDLGPYCIVARVLIV